MRIDLPHPLSGSVPLVANPIRFSKTAPRYERAPPLLGQHTDEVLGELQLGASEIAALRAARIV
jgi:crotonobetainyl-CoA:carnitine CoA-transferase CaiB-like acyl-CoA transferase